MIQLYGLPMSNYYSLAKALLIEKDLAFEEVKAPPTQEEDNLARSPMGKMPSIGVDGRYLSESLAIASYLERLQPEPALLPADPFEAAKVIELVCHLKLDVELVARRCLPAAFFGATASEETKESTQADLIKGMKAIDRIFQGDPYAAGSTTLRKWEPVSPRAASSSIRCCRAPRSGRIPPPNCFAKPVDLRLETSWSIPTFISPAAARSMT